jgi:hypothetical protein
LKNNYSNTGKILLFALKGAKKMPKKKEMRKSSNNYDFLVFINLSLESRTQSKSLYIKYVIIVMFGVQLLIFVPYRVPPGNNILDAKW